jgi:hypothetical protein
VVRVPAAPGKTRASRPQLPVEGAVLDGFGDVFAGDVFTPGKIGNRAGDFQDSIVGARAQFEVSHGEFQQFHGVGIDGAMALEFAAAHAGVAGELWFGGEARMLALPGGHDAFANLRGGFAGALAGDFAKLHLRHFNVEINAVEQWAGDTAKIVLDFAGRASRLMRHFPVRGARRCLFVNGLQT